jgi:hypothetical protein
MTDTIDFIVPSWEANSRSSEQKIPRVLRKPDTEYWVHEIQPLDAVLTLLYAVYTLYLGSVLILS